MLDRVVLGESINIINLLSMFLMYFSILTFFGANKKYYLSNKHRLLLFNSSAWWEKVGYFISPFFACLIIVQSFRYLFFGYDILLFSLAKISFWAFVLVESYQLGFIDFKQNKREVFSNHGASNSHKESSFDIVFSILAIFGFIFGIISVLISLYVHQNHFFEQISLICFSIMRIAMWGNILKNRQRKLC